MDYEYSQGDRIASPHFYMYTSYHGEPFLKAYLADRQAFGADVTSESVEEASAELRRRLAALTVPAGDAGSTAEVLLTLATQVLEGAPLEESYPTLSAYVRKFEVSKKLYERYDQRLRPAGDEYCRLTPYVLLGAACTAYYLRHGNLKMLNCSLKLGDLMVSCAERFEDLKLQAVAAAALGLEALAVQKLAAKCGVMGWF